MKPKFARNHEKVSTSANTLVDNPAFAKASGDKAAFAKASANRRTFANVAIDKSALAEASAGRQDKWIDKQDIMMQMNISDRTLYNWRKNKILPYTKIGGKIYYRQSDLKAVLEKNAQ